MLNIVKSASGGKKLLAIIALVPFIMIGCNKASTTDEAKVAAKTTQNPWLQSLWLTPIWSTPTGVPTKAKSGPTKLWRKWGRDSVGYSINIDGPDSADVPLDIKWYDTLVVVYDDTDTVRKPTPAFNGNFDFYYHVVNDSWAFAGLTPAQIKSDSADGWVTIDSVQISVNGVAKPSITNLTQVIGYANYPYVFNVGDSVKVTVYKSGTVSDDTAWVFLHAPLGDYVGFFNHISTGVWSGTWVPKTPHAYRWGWVDVFDLGVIFNKTQMTERTRLWGIPYKVE